MPSKDRLQTSSRNPRGRTWTSLRVLYNLFLLVLGAGCFCWLAPLVRLKAKRRDTFGPRMGWCAYAWEGQGVPDQGRRIWIHALSVGEVTASQAMVRHLLAKGDHSLFLSASTLSGYQTARRLYAGLPVRLAYFPYDWLWAVRAVASKIKPDLALLVETDIWPNFIWEMERRGVPVCLANIRLSDQAWRWYRRLAPVAKVLFGGFARIAVQTEKDRRRILHLGIDPARVCVTGNIKFDVRYAPPGHDAVTTLGATLKGFPGLKVFVAGSTHEGEETFLVQTLVRVKRRQPGVLLIIAPRDPGRAGRILKLSAEQGIMAHRMSNPDLVDRILPGHLVVVDSLGLLMDLYSLSDLAYVGGSLVSQGGHNPLEPAACAKPVLFGPDMRDFRQIAAWLIRGGGARQVDAVETLTSAAAALLSDDELARDMGERARQVYLGHRGAVERTLACFGLIDGA